jgi:hypothetical protein
MTAGDVIKRALRLIGAIDAGADPTSTEMADALSALNGMTAGWSAGRNAIFAPTTKTHTLTAGTASYTIGAGATIDTPRPNKVLAAFVRSGNIDYPLRAEALLDYAGRGLKTTGGIPEKLYLETGFPLATIYLYPAPAAAYELHLSLWSPLPTYSAPGDDLALPGEYQEAVAYNLAGRLAPEFGREVPVTVAALASDSFAALKRLNAQPVGQIRTDVVIRSRSYDINGDQWT